jgi:LacI family transcriptional regulator
MKVSIVKRLIFHENHVIMTMLITEIFWVGLKMGKISSRPKLADVARLANVSITSVSRLINNSGPINQETRARIEDAMANLGFEPRHTPAKGGEQTIAVVTGDLLNAYFPEIIRGVQEEADSYGMLTILFALTDVPQRQHQILQKLSKRVADAIVVMGSPLFQGLAEVQSRYHIPLVVINRRANGIALGSIAIDFENAGYRSCQHLLMLGHTRIGFISNFNSSLDVSEARRHGVEQALHDAGLCLRPEWSLVCPPGQEMDGGYHAMSALLSHAAIDRPTAIVCFNDGVAVGVEHAIRACGLRVPEDISVVGFDDIALAAHASPPLTTISQPKYRIGMMAVQMLRKMMRDPEALGDSIQTECPLIVRESTAPCSERILT